MKKLTQKRLKELLHYDPKTGVFTWRVDRTGKAKAGSIAGTPQFSKGQWYWRLKINGVSFIAHRVAWLYVHGKFPGKPLDHADGDGQNNAIKNLREATLSQNMGNRKKNRTGKTAFKGVTMRTTRRGTKLWRPQLQVDNKTIPLGHYKSAEEAAHVYDAAARKAFGKFARVNFP